MGFLQRSKSAGITDRRTRKKEPKPPIPGQVPVKASSEGKRSTSFERPKTADAASFSRPRTANAAIGRTSDWTPPSFKIDVKAENEVFSFPMPSPLIQAPDIPVVKKRPSPLQELGSPAIGVAIGSPSQAPTQTRPVWGRSVTADSISPRMPVQPPPTRAPPAIPSHLDLEILSNDVSKKRKSAWKSLGGLFCRRQTIVRTEEPLYRLKMPNAIEERDIIIPDLAELSEYGSTPTFGPRSSSLLVREQIRFEGDEATDKDLLKPAGLTIITRSPPAMQMQKESFSPMFRTINGIPEDKNATDNIRRDSPLSITFPNSFRSEQKSSNDPDAPQLAILDLPDPSFERYSIMFEKLLVSDSSPSLLERRLSKLQRNRSFKKLDLFPAIDSRQEIPRLQVNGIPQQQNATSPSLAKSLSVRIGKKVLSPVTEAFTALSRPHSIRRSRTAPSSAISPRSPNFPTTPRIEVQTVDDCTSPTSFCGSMEYSSSLPATPLTFTTFSDSGSMMEVVEIIETEDLEQQQPTTLINNQSPHAKQHPAELPSRDSMIRMTPKPLRIKSDKRIVHVSVARKVSVGAAAGAVQNVVQEKEESNLSELGRTVTAKQPLRARMVELGGGKSLNRSSTTVLIEIAEE